MSTDKSRRDGAMADRDRILEQALKHQLRATGTPPAGLCLDAETLGAWTDGGLDATAAAAVEAHISNCSRCQALAGTMARGTLSTPDTSGTSGTSSTAGAFAWWKWGLAPLAAGITAATLWMVIPEEQQIAVAPPQAKESPAAPTSRADVDQFATRDSASPARQNREQPPAVVQDKLEAAPQKIEERAALADSAGATASAAARAEAAPAAPPAAVVALEPSPAPQLGALQKRAASELALRFEVATLRPSVRWRVVGDFLVELTLDSGATWVRKRQLPGINAGSAPSALVCWFAGGNGAVWLTTDGGATFRDIGLAEPLDIASISAADATTAQVFTVSGRRFQTADAGRTWQPF